MVVVRPKVGARAAPLAKSVEPAPETFADENAARVAWENEHPNGEPFLGAAVEGPPGPRMPRPALPEPHREPVDLAIARAREAPPPPLPEPPPPHPLVGKRMLCRSYRRGEAWEPQVGTVVEREPGGFLVRFDWPGGAHERFFADGEVEPAK